jgi:hypothetical protein
MSFDRELEYIKLKVDWYKTAFPWILAMVVGAVSLAGAIKDNPSSDFILTILISSVVFLLAALISTWYASLALIHRLEESYKTNSKLLNRFLWVPHGTKWETVFATTASMCLGAGLASFVGALIAYAIFK